MYKADFTIRSQMPAIDLFWQVLADAPFRDSTSLACEQNVFVVWVYIVLLLGCLGGSLSI